MAKSFKKLVKKTGNKKTKAIAKKRTSELTEEVLEHFVKARLEHDFHEIVRLLIDMGERKKAKKEKKVIGAVVKKMWFSKIREIYDIYSKLEERRGYRGLSNPEEEVIPQYNYIKQWLDKNKFIVAEDYRNEDGNIEVWLPGFNDHWEEENPDFLSPDG